MSRRITDHQSAAVQHSDELLQVAKRDLLRREALFETVLDLLQADVPVQHVQNVELFVMEPKVLESDRFFDDPVAGALVLVPAVAKVRTLAHRQRP